MQIWRVIFTLVVDECYRATRVSALIHSRPSLRVYTIHFSVHKRFIQDLSGFLFQCELQLKPQEGWIKNSNIFAQRSEREVTFGERIIEGTIGEGYSVYFVPSCWKV